MNRHDTSAPRPKLKWAVFFFATLVSPLFVAGTSLAQTPVQKTILLEVFTRGDSELSDKATQYAIDLGNRTTGLEVKIHDVLADKSQLSRVWKLARKFGRDKPTVPSFYCCNRMYFGFASAEKTDRHVQDLFTAHVYTRSTCPKCRNAKAFFSKLNRQWPALKFQIYEVTHDAYARQRWQELCRSRNQLPGLPTTLFAGQVMIGYRGDHLTGRDFQQLVERVANPEPKSAEAKPAKSQPAGLGMDVSRALSPLALISILQAPAEDTPAEPEPDFDEVPLPDEATLDDLGEASLESEVDPPSDSSGVDDTMVVPIFGELRVSDLGLPAFSFLVGLVDGFNPCAMWVLVFLLSVLVNIKDRKKIVLIAGTFVFISGLAYFAFMAAWLEVFLLVGIVRWVQVLLGIMAITIGLINVKDFFAFKKGISLSIPESSKPGIYARVRKIVAAEYLTAALMGAVVLAIVVNVVELLCTAGLPALYTQILTMHELPKWQNYFYLAIYISAYMLDDTVLLTIVVVTLSHRKLQEREGRWLKLLSGLVILVLGVVMIFKPEWMKLGQ